MMIQAIRLTRKKAALAVILAGAVLAALILLLGQRGGNVGAVRAALSFQQRRAGGISAGTGLGDRPGAADHVQFLLPPKLSGDYSPTTICKRRRAST